MELLLYVLAGLLLLFLLSLTPLGAGFRRWCMAKAYTAAQRKFEPWIGEHKRQLFAGLSGTVLEIGPGNGANFAHLPDSVQRWIGIEPNHHMHDELRRAGAQRGIEADFRSIAAEAMDVEDASIDVVLSTLVLCSVPDPEAVVRDIHRILKPGGRFVFVEHVAAPRGSRLRWMQRFAKPFWWYFADGCRPDRELAAVIRRGAFAAVDMDELTAPKGVAPAVVSPIVAGTALKSPADASARDDSTA